MSMTTLFTITLAPISLLKYLRMNLFCLTTANLVNPAIFLQIISYKNINLHHGTIKNKEFT
jgi:hypothetical protein